MGKPKEVRIRETNPWNWGIGAGTGIKEEQGAKTFKRRTRGTVGYCVYRGKDV